MGMFEHTPITDSIIMRAAVCAVVIFMLFLLVEVKHVPLELKLLPGPV